MDTRIVSNIKFLQLNTDKSLASTFNILQLAADTCVDVVCLQEPYFYVNHTYENVKQYLPPEQIQFNCFYVNNSERPPAAVFVMKFIEASLVSNMSNSPCVTGIVLTRNHNINVSSVYPPPSDKCPFHRFDPIVSNSSKNMLDRTILCSDSNSKSTLWGSSFTDSKGQSFESFLLGSGMNVINDTSSLTTFDNGRGGASWIDATAADHSVIDKISDRTIEDNVSLSFHKILSFQINNIPKQRDNKINLHRTDWDKFVSILSCKITDNCLQESLLALEQEIDIHTQLESIHSKFCNILQASLIESTPLPKDHNHK